MAISIARRKFFAGLCGTALARPLGARAQQADKLPIIGFLGPNASSFSAWTRAFAERLRELGWIEGRTITIEYRWSEARQERVAEFAAEFARQKVDVIVTYGGAVIALKQATAAIPIVFAIAGDPIGSGLVESLARPGGNVTGLSIQATDIVGKRLELLREAVPISTGWQSCLTLAIPQPCGRLVRFKPRLVRSASKPLHTKSGVRRILRPCSRLLSPKRTHFTSWKMLLFPPTGRRSLHLALGARLPTTFGNRDEVQAGGLISYGPNFPAMFRRAADFVDKILRGTKPGDIPVEQPTKFDLVINLKTAKALGVTVPASLLVPPTR